MKKIRPCKILRKFLANAYELELPVDINISSIFNVANLYLYRGDTTKTTYEVQEQTKILKQWFPTVRQRGIDRILDKRVAKKMRSKEYFQYLVKCKGYPSKYVTWKNEKGLVLQGFDLAYI